MISSMCRLSMNLTPALRAVYSTEREMTKPPLMQLGAPRESARAPGPPQIWVQGLKSDCLSSSMLPAGRRTCLWLARFQIEGTTVSLRSSRVWHSFGTDITTYGPRHQCQKENLPMKWGCEVMGGGRKKFNF